MPILAGLNLIWWAGEKVWGFYRSVRCIAINEFPGLWVDAETP